MKIRIIRNPEHYFNRYIACEILNDGKKAKEIREMEVSLEEVNEYPQDLICNRYGESFENIGDLLDSIESKVLFAALSALSPDQIKLIKLIYSDCLTQRETSLVLGVSQKTVCKRIEAIHIAIKKYFAETGF